MGILLF